MHIRASRGCQRRGQNSELAMIVTPPGGNERAQTGLSPGETDPAQLGLQGKALVPQVHEHGDIREKNPVTEAVRESAA